MTIAALRNELKKVSDPRRAAFFARFFKVDEAERGQGDQFLGGLTAQAMRRIAIRHAALELADVKTLLASRIHEHRFVAAEMLVYRYEHGGAAEKRRIFSFYVKHRRLLNNWDLVDTSVQYIVGDYLFDKNKALLYRLARSPRVYERRMAMVATQAFIRRGEFKDALAIAKALLRDPHQIMHRAVGWMLREVGQGSLRDELAFLNAHAAEMPALMLSYATERLAAKRREMYRRARKRKRR